MTKKTKLVLAGGDKPQYRKAGPRSWTKNKEANFVSALTETCNVTRACEAAQVSISAAYKRRQENASFRAAWLKALSVAYQQLELVLLERAFNGTERPISAKAGEPTTMRE